VHSLRVEHPRFIITSNLPSWCLSNEFRFVDRDGRARPAEYKQVRSWSPERSSARSNSGTTNSSNRSRLRCRRSRAWPQFRRDGSNAGRTAIPRSQARAEHKGPLTVIGRSGCAKFAAKEGTGVTESTRVQFRRDPRSARSLDAFTTDSSTGARCVLTTRVQPRIDSFAGIPVSRTRPTSSAWQ
jgi:hypothetical protein